MPIVMTNVVIQEPLEIVQRSRVLFRVSCCLRTHRWTRAGSVGRRLVRAVLAIEQGSLA